ncbi:hypothetical protein AF72_09145 [Xylella taiwanensis]|uniref:Uncharacterized protein n=1 Tax=Xylella taiwanensis TaxID=1444770 RepID=Z9JHY6_9GAMM|nr:hypothetical protein AF72_09145 [Xylella taiwanensis]
MLVWMCDALHRARMSSNTTAKTLRGIAWWHAGKEGFFCVSIKVLVLCVPSW